MWLEKTRIIYQNSPKKLKFILIKNSPKKSKDYFKQNSMPKKLKIIYY
jgi:hypothetical protein